MRKKSLPVKTSRVWEPARLFPAQPASPKSLDRGKQAEISEIFASIQGEGPYLGVKQIFVRFGRCNMLCVYCDELPKMQAERFSIHTGDDIEAQIEALEKKEGPHHSISLTGGEPLFYQSFLMSFLPALKAKGRTTYLETNGTMPAALERLISYCDIVAMDIKPSSSTGDRDFMREHERFLKIAAAKDVFVKIVVTPETTAKEMEECIRLVERIKPQAPFILQPLSDSSGINSASLDLIKSEFFDAASRSLADVRIIPQMHKVWGVR